MHNGICFLLTDKLQQVISLPSSINKLQSVPKETILPFVDATLTLLPQDTHISQLEGITVYMDINNATRWNLDLRVVSRHRETEQIINYCFYISSPVKSGAKARISQVCFLGKKSRRA